MFGFRLGYEVVGRTTPGEGTTNKNSHTGNTGNKSTCLLFAFVKSLSKQDGQDREEKEKERESEERKKERKRASGGRAAPQFWLQMGNACACDR